MSVGGWFVACGNGSSASDERTAVIVQLPENCTLLAPADTLGAMTSGTPVITVKPGMVHFQVDDNGRTVEFDKKVEAGQHTITLDRSEF